MPSLAHSTCLQRQRSHQTSLPIKRVKKKKPDKVRVTGFKGANFFIHSANMVILPIQEDSGFPYDFLNYSDMTRKHPVSS